MKSFMNWYDQLDKPSWTPTAATIGKIWTVLYPIIFLTHGAVIYKATQQEISWLVAMPFLLNLLFNFSFSPLQFGIHNNWLTLLDAALIFVTIIWGIIAIWPHTTWIAYANLPYLLWVGTATVLQFQISWRNT